MVQTRSATRLKSGASHPPRDNAIKPRPDDCANPQPQAKRRRRGDAQTVKKPHLEVSGSQVQLNLDVLHLLAEYIDPLDLLNLARTCKSLRRLLMDKSSEFVWKAARRQVEGMPDCPADLSEPAYANLAFCDYCHGCGKHTTNIYWRIRRRYCSRCRDKRLCAADGCPSFIRNEVHLIAENVIKNRGMMVDNEQMKSVVQEYECSLDKEQFLRDQGREYRARYHHAKSCADWEAKVASERKIMQKAYREERDRNILERLVQLGFESEIHYFGYDRFRESRKKSTKPLTDEEWTAMLPQWLETLNHYRHLRLDRILYQRRRHILEWKYKRYRNQQSADKPNISLLPHVIDLATFPPFKTAIEAPEEAQLNNDLFTHAFSQLPSLISTWRQELDDELSELVDIPCLSSSATSFDAGVASNTSRAGALQTGSDKLQLAAAMFYMCNTTLYTPLEALSVSLCNYHYPQCKARNLKRTGSIEDRFKISFLEEAPYVVRACGLDPNVATVDDMDRRNARLKCLVCKTPHINVMNWRSAMLHALSVHEELSLAPPYKSPRWQLVSVNMNQVVGRPIRHETHPPKYVRCLLCLPCVGDALVYNDESLRYHFFDHSRRYERIEEGVHYVRLGISQDSST